MCSHAIANNEVKNSSLIEKQTIIHSTAININKADVKALSSLKGIGQKKAQAIVDFRNVNGEFTSVDQLLNIKGIGKNIVEDNKARIAI